MEIFSKGKVSDDIECGPMVPIGQVDLSSGRSLNLLLEAIDEEFDLCANQGFLFLECFVREGMAEKTAHATVVSVICSDDVIIPGIDAEVFGKAGMPLTMAAQVFPG